MLSGYRQLAAEFVWETIPIFQSSRVSDYNQKFGWIRHPFLSWDCRYGWNSLYAISRLNSEKYSLKWETVSLMREQAAVVNLTRLWCVSLANWAHQLPLHGWSPVFSHSSWKELRRVSVVSYKLPKWTALHCVDAHPLAKMIPNWEQSQFFSRKVWENRRSVMDCWLICSIRQWDTLEEDEIYYNRLFSHWTYSFPYSLYSFTFQCNFSPNWILKCYGLPSGIPGLYNSNLVCLFAESAVQKCVSVSNQVMADKIMTSGY